MRESGREGEGEKEREQERKRERERKGERVRKSARATEGEEREGERGSGRDVGGGLRERHTVRESERA